MTSTATLDGISDQEPVEVGLDANGDPVDDFAGGEQSWPTPGTSAAQGGHGQQVGRATPSAAAQDDGAARAGTAERARADQAAAVQRLHLQHGRDQQRPVREEVPG